MRPVHKSVCCNQRNLIDAAKLLFFKHLNEKEQCAIYKHRFNDPSPGISDHRYNAQPSPAIDEATLAAYKQMKDAMTPEEENYLKETCSTSTSRQGALDGGTVAALDG